MLRGSLTKETFSQSHFKRIKHSPCQTKTKKTPVSLSRHCTEGTLFRSKKKVVLQVIFFNQGDTVQSENVDANGCLQHPHARSIKGVSKIIEPKALSMAAAMQPVIHCIHSSPSWVPTFSCEDRGEYYLHSQPLQHLSKGQSPLCYFQVSFSQPHSTLQEKVGIVGSSLALPGLVASSQYHKCRSQHKASTLCSFFLIPKEMNFGITSTMVD